MTDTQYLIKTAVTSAAFYDAIASWDGFVTLRPEEPCEPARRVHELKYESNGEWGYDFHWKRPTAIVEPVGCYFLKEVDLWAPGVALHRGRVIHDESHPSADMVQSISGAFRDGSFAIPKPTDRIIDSPALLADGLNHRTWGHWIVDYLPRFGIARALLGAGFDDLVIPLPYDIPTWAVKLLMITCGVKEKAIVSYHPWTERLRIARAVQPSFCFTEAYTFHSFFREFYQNLRTPASSSKRKLCVSRGGEMTAGSNRNFPLRHQFEDIAREYGYDVVQPETLSLADQIALFSGASVVVGEHGSGMHNTVFCGPDTVVGCLGFWNPIQLNLDCLLQHHNVYVMRDCEWPTADDPTYRLNVTEASMISMFDKIEQIGGSEK